MTKLHPDCEFKDGTSTGHEDLLRFSMFEAISVNSATMQMSGGVLVQYATRIRQSNGVVQRTERIAYIKGQTLIWSNVIN